MSDELDNPQPSFSAARKLSAGVGVLSAVVALLAIVVMINFLSARHFHRWVLSEDRVTSLAPLTHQVLGALTNELQVTVFFDPDEVLYSHILQLLRQYENASPRVKVTVVNYLTEPARAEEVKARCKLGPNTPRMWSSSRSQATTASSGRRSFRNMTPASSWRAKAKA